MSLFFFASSLSHSSSSSWTTTREHKRRRTRNERRRAKTSSCSSTKDDVLIEDDLWIEKRAAFTASLEEGKDNSILSEAYRERTGRYHIYRATVSYDGTNYKGFQLQDDAVETIQSELERVLTTVAQVDRDVLCLGGAGRTDAGVHARKQVVHFYTTNPLKDKMNAQRACNRLLNDDVRILEIAKPHPTFHSRFHCTKKTYRYTIDFGVPHNSFYRTTAMSVGHRKYDLAKIVEACKLFVGTHDFSAFMNRLRDGKNAEQSAVRTIYAFDVVPSTIFTDEECSTDKKKCYVDESSSLVHLYVTGNGFLYRQVRNMVGAILAVASGRFTLEELKSLMEKRDRKLLPMGAPAKGLCLYDVQYPSELYDYCDIM